MIDYLIENKSIIELLIVSSIGITSFVFIIMVAKKKNKFISFKTRNKNLNNLYE